MSIIMYTIYDNPTDFPGEFVVKKWVINPNGTMNQDLTFIKTAKTLEGARQEMYLIPDVSFPIRRSPDDDPVIVETWI